MSRKQHQELLTEPGPLIKSNIVAASLADNYEEAKLEWNYVGQITNESPEFRENCEVCNSRLYKENHIIHNANTGNVFYIGSECIKRFFFLNGTTSVEDNIQFFEQQVKERKIIIELNVLFRDVLEDPVPLARNVNKFRKYIMTLLEQRGQLHLINTVEGIKEIHNTIFPNKPYIPKLEDILQGKKIVMQRETKRYKEFIKEGQTWAKKGKVTHVSLSKSETYRNPADKY